MKIFTLKKELASLKEQGASSLIQELYRSSLPDIFVCKDSNAKHIYADNQTTIAMGFNNSGDSIGYDDTFMKAPIVECAEQFIKEDKFIFETKKKYISIGSFQYANSRYHIIHLKEILYDPTLKKDIEICLAYKMSDPVINLLESALKFNEKFHIKYKKNKILYTSYPISLYQNETPLTKQETACLFYLLRGKTAESIAKLLHRSRRTIECHIDHIKLKFKCRTKEELIEKSIEMGFLNILPPTFDHIKKLTKFLL